MKGHLFVLKNIPVKPFYTADHAFVFSFFAFCASPRFQPRPQPFSPSSYSEKMRWGRGCQDSSRSKTTKQEKVLWSMVYFYDNALAQNILNFC